MSHSSVYVCMQAPAAARMNGGGAVPAAAAMAPDAVNSMDPIQRECWSIYNNPEAQAGDSGISVDDVSLVLCESVSKCCLE